MALGNASESGVTRHATTARGALKTAKVEAGPDPARPVAPTPRAGVPRPGLPQKLSRLGVQTWERGSKQCLHFSASASPHIQWEAPTPTLCDQRGLCLAAACQSPWKAQRIRNSGPKVILVPEACASLLLERAGGWEQIQFFTSWVSGSGPFPWRSVTKGVSSSQLAFLHLGQLQAECWGHAHTGLGAGPGGQDCPGLRPGLPGRQSCETGRPRRPHLPLVSASPLSPREWSVTGTLTF